MQNEEDQHTDDGLIITFAETYTRKKYRFISAMIVIAIISTIAIYGNQVETAIHRISNGTIL